MQNVMLTLKTEARENKKAANEALRNEGKIPAVFYGAKQETTPIAISAGDFLRVWNEAGESTIITLETANGKLDTLIHEVQFNPVTDEPVHADFYVVDKDKEIYVEVPLEFEGVAPAVKELGGILVKVMHELEVKTRPQDLPHNIVIDISVLKDMDSHISVKDITLPNGVVATANPDEIVAAVSAAREEEEAPATEVDMSSIEVEKKGKKEEEAAAE